MRTFNYMIDLDERGEFQAHVKNSKGNVVVDIDGFDLVEDGWMKHTRDIDGLKEFLVTARMMKDNDELVLGDAE